jgi:hypothetical protein
LYLNQINLFNALTVEYIIFGMFDESKEKYYILLNHLLLLGKQYIYQSSLQCQTPSWHKFVILLMDIKTMETNIAINNKQYNKFKNKWLPIITDCDKTAVNM